MCEWLNIQTPRLTADQLSKANSTNLAIKGIIGIQALSQISQILNKESDSTHYAVRDFHSTILVVYRD